MWASLDSNTSFSSVFKVILKIGEIAPLISVGITLVTFLDFFQRLVLKSRNNIYWKSQMFSFFPEPTKLVGGSVSSHEARRHTSYT